MSRYCSQYGNNGHISRTYAGDSGAGTGTGEIMLFGVRVTVDPMRKSVSMSNLSQYEQPHETSIKDKADVPAGDAYASADDAVQHSSGSRERKRGVPWSEEEHKLFLIGLQKVGKGDWRGISRSFVTTRTPTQVASHAQKYFLRRHNYNRRRRRSSLFDITSESISAMATEEQVKPQDNKSQPYLPRLDTCNTGGFSLVPSNPIPAIPVPVRTSPVPIHMLIENPTQDLTQGLASQVNHQSMNLIRPIPFLAVPPDLSTDLDLDIRSTVDPSSLSLKLSLSLDHSSRQYAFQAMPNFNEGDGIISVA